ncbi:uncharacterized protein LOC125225878 [Leguminivora glycinivorella]|uniref:uncharacterized protein LOC125225878 n=1 Tax=Leguminivora glycinivorella TaxID=1035111 RepID=UPI00200EEFFB|nr:uncharacterized protein LOC125225878 [Leguminivora glycinivorella]
MESVLQPPPPFVFENNLVNVTSGNLSKEWDKWKKSFMIYYAACEIDKKDVTVQINILLHVIGERCRDVYDQFTDKTKCDTVNKVLEKFDCFFFPKKNLTIERHRFFTRDQSEFESVEQYVFELNKMAVKCEFKDLCQDLVRDRLICGIRDGSLRERLLREPDLTLTKAVEIGNLAELSRAQAVTLKSESTEHHHVHGITNESQNTNAQVNEIDAIQKNRRFSRAQRSRSSRARPGGQWSRPGPSRQQEQYQDSRGARGRQTSSRYHEERQWHNTPRYRGCSQCGGVHAKFKCPAYGQQCLNCKRFNHYSRMCGVYEVREDSSDQGSTTS